MRELYLNTKLMLIASLLVSGSVWAQGAAPSAEASSPVFEVASIRPSDPDELVKIVRLNFGQDGYSAIHATLQMLIKEAYGVNDIQISSAPKWAASTRYEIEAKIDSNTLYDLSKLNKSQVNLAHSHMLQSLLADRFNLVLHHESRNLPLYSLVITKNGSKLHEAKSGDAYADGIKTPSGELVGPHRMLMQLGGGQISAQGLPLGDLVKELTSQLGMIVVDKTGLTGKYDFNLQWTPDNSLHAFNDPNDGQQVVDSPANSSPSIFTALQEQLGLKLERETGSVDVLVIDHVEQPSAN